MSSAALSLAPFEIAVGGGSAALTRQKLVRVHAKAHGASGLTPVETRGNQYIRDAFFLGLRLYKARSGHDHGFLNVIRNFFALDDFGHFAKVFYPCIGAGTDKDQ